MTHELGHNFGLGHANAAELRRRAGPGSRSPRRRACTSVGYADPFSTMGNNALRHNHGASSASSAGSSASEKVVAVPGNTYTITPYFGSRRYKLVRVPRGDGTFFDLDFRTTYSIFDTFTAGSPATMGVTIRLAMGTASPTTSPKATNLSTRRPRRATSRTRR